MGHQSKAEEIKLRFEFEAQLRAAGIPTQLTPMGSNYINPQAQEMWQQVKLQGALS